MHRQFTLVSSRMRKKAPVHIIKEAHWARQLCAAEPRAWAQLVAQWSPRLYSYVIYNVATETEAQEVVRFIFADVVQTVVGSLRIANLTVCIFSIAYQHILRHRQQHPLPPPRVPRQSSLGATTDDDPATAFLETFHHFTPELQQILLLHYLCDVSLSDISQIVGQTEESLTKILYRAQLYLR